jgi:transketolase
MNRLSELAARIRRHSLQMVHDAQASHIASALSIADILAVLYGEIMRHDPRNSQWDLRDRLILSKGHACVAVYGVLAELGYFDKAELKNYGKDFSVLMNHISHKVNGVEFSTGSLGHGLPFGVGKALAAKVANKPWHVYVILSDGEMDEGSNWEALMFSAHHKLSNLTAIVDYNKLQSLDSVSNTLSLEPLADKLHAFGATVFEVDGHNLDDLVSALKRPKADSPTVILSHTIKGKGVSFMENRVEWHYKSPNVEQLTAALAEIN